MSIIGSRVLGGAGQQPYLVGRSLRFRASASAYLNRTFSGSPTSTTKQTFSAWVKRGSLGGASAQFLFAGYDGTSNGATQLYFTTTDSLALNFGGTTANTIQTTQVFRDPSAWYHIIVSIDTTQATASNRVLFYINGVQVTSFSATSYPSQNATSQFVLANANNKISSAWNTVSFLDGYLAEVNFIDGQSLAPSSFGAYDTNGVWQPKKYSGTYGTNGFYLPFSNTTSTTTLVQDSSGNGNNWTPNNISLTAGTTYDSMIDSPTVSNASSNYCTLNPIASYFGGQSTLTDGNLNYSSPNPSSNYAVSGVRGTTMFSSGKFYWEATITLVPGVNGNYFIGVCDSDAGLNSGSGFVNGYMWAYSPTGGLVYVNNSTVATVASSTVNDVLGFAFDRANGTMSIYKNNTLLTTQTGTPSGTGGNWVPAHLADQGFNNDRKIGYNYNFGQRPFTYTPPTGYVALNTQNLPQPTIMNGAKYMQATLYTGNGSSTQTIAQSVTGNSATFLPDFVWTKGRSGATNNIQIDTVRGGANYLISDSTSAEVYNAAAAIQSFSSNGYVIGNGGAVNTNAATYVSWQWNAGSGVTSTNTSGTISSLVSVNASAGFSIVSYVGTGVSNATVGHSLGAVPSMVIVKPRGSATDGNWRVKTTGLSSNNNLALNLTDAQFNVTTSSNGGIGDLSSSTTFTLVNGTATNNNVNQINIPYIAYCWSAVAGYSAFGSYTGNGSSDGPFVYIGFRPRWVMIKNITTGGANYDWVLIDSSREPYNVTQNDLAANTSASETSGILSQPNDFLSNGFKIRASGVNAYPTNASGSTYIYAAFAENPFKVSRAR